jgi:signal transduction histidine kinase
MTASNDGNPISDANQDNIFDAFFAPAATPNGTGMGLPSSRP